ncbi:MAG TPA: hypothetical protein VNO52_04470 [Methylomirabilota bacterium]|nr:hypothetical protein [Methylomirabilota bacterium]
MDLGTVVSGDADGDGLPDAWELAQFGNLGHGPGSVGASGQSLWNSYLAGNDPGRPPHDVFRRTITRDHREKLVSFYAPRATGRGCEGMTRLYGLEFNTSLGVSSWFPVPNHTIISGSETILIYSTVESSPNVVFKGQVRLIRPRPLAALQMNPMSVVDFMVPCRKEVGRPLVLMQTRVHPPLRSSRLKNRVILRIVQAGWHGTSSFRS